MERGLYVLGPNFKRKNCMTKDTSKIESEFKDPFVNSKGFKKLWNYFLHIINSEEFQKDIEKIRDKFKIDIKDKTNKDSIKYSLYSVELEKLTKKYGLDSSTWWTSLEPYIFNGEVIPPIDTDLCILSDNINDPDLSEQSINCYPVSIRISQYASKRDIFDFVNRFFPIISSIQKNYKEESVKIGKFKTKKKYIQNRNNFIYKNRFVYSHKKLMTITNKRFPHNMIFDYGYIGKIIYTETRRRKKV